MASLPHFPTQWVPRKRVDCGSAGAKQSAVFTVGGHPSPHLKMGASEEWLWGHPSGWLFNQAEGVYFHTASGKLFVDEGSTGPVQLDGGGHESLGAPARLKGCIRWFSHKGFGFIEPDDQQGLSGDVYAHRSELQQPEGEISLTPKQPLIQHKFKQ
eukprot:s2885_g5.t1